MSVQLPINLVVQHIIDETQAGKYGDSTPTIWLPSSFAPLFQSAGSFLLIAYNNIVVCARPTFILPSFLREIGDTRVVKVQENHCIISLSLSSNLKCQLGDSVCLCNPIITKEQLIVATEIRLSRVPPEALSSTRVVGNFADSVKQSLAVYLSGQVVHAGMKLQMSWFNFVDEVALLHVAEPSFVSASALVGSDQVKFKAPVPSIVVETTKIILEPWSLEKFTASRVFLQPEQHSVSKLSESWFHSVTKEFCGYDHIVESLCSLCRCSLIAEDDQAAELLPLGFLIFGGHGTGKSALLSSAARHSGINSVSMDCSAVFSSGEGDAERLIGSHFDRAKSLAPCFLVLDDLDMIAPNRHDISGGPPCAIPMERRVISRILSEIDSLRQLRGSRRVFILASARSPDQIDASLLQPKRIERSFEIRPPLPHQRRAILDVHAANIPFSSESEMVRILDLVSINSHGRVGADLESICRSALTRAITRSPKDARVLLEDFEAAMQSVGASSLAEMSRGSWTDGASALNRRITRFADIGGLKRQINELKVNAVLPFKDPSKLTAIGIRPPKGILITGPPGTGKTLLANAAILDAGVNSISISGTELLSQYVGDSEKRLAELFKRARTSAPCIIFIDQFESIARERGQDSSEDQSADRVLSALLTELDGVTDTSNNELVMLIAATSRPELLDSAVKRPGRIDCVVCTNFLDKQERKDLLVSQLQRCNTVLVDEDLESLASKTAGLSGADVVNLIREAAFSCIRQSMESGHEAKLSMTHLQRALDDVYKGGSQEPTLFQSPFGFGPSPFAAGPSTSSSTPKFTM